MFGDYTNVISIVYYLNMSGIVVYINQCNLNFNLLNSLLNKINFKFIIVNWDNITYKNLINGIKYIIDYIINNKDKNKIIIN